VAGIRTLLPHRPVSSWPRPPCMGLLLPGGRRPTTSWGNLGPGLYGALPFMALCRAPHSPHFRPPTRDRARCPDHRADPVWGWAWLVCSTSWRVISPAPRCLLLLLVGAVDRGPPRVGPVGAVFQSGRVHVLLCLHLAPAAQFRCKFVWSWQPYLPHVTGTALANRHRPGSLGLHREWLSFCWVAISLRLPLGAAP